MTVGDSWLDKLFGRFSPNLYRPLLDLGYSIDVNRASIMLTMQAIADFAAAAVARLPSVQMVLLDGGGNDVHQKPSYFEKPQNPDWSQLPDTDGRSTLDDLLQGAAGTVALNSDAVKDFIDTNLRGQLRRALRALTNAPNAKPVVVIGYDFPIPIPHERTSAVLAPAFARVGLKAEVPADLAKSTDMMKQLITHLNDMIEDLVKSEFAGKAFAVRLTGTLTFGDPSEWDDELHPTQAGFEKLAAALDKALRLLPLPHPVP